jgi:hypothetical protein
MDGWASPGQTVEQVWFCGCHSDVGGGVSAGANDDGTTLSDITLGWMMQHAAALGIEIAPAVLARYTIPLLSKYALDEIHPSWTPLYGFPKSRTIPSDSCFSNSVAIGCQHDASYRPSNLILDNGVPAAAYSLAALLT